MKKEAIMLAVAGILACARMTQGEEAPKGFAYQGVLSDPVSGALAGEQKVTFRLFDGPSEGIALWETNQTVVCAEGGLFHAWLAGDELEQAFLDAGKGPFARYLELEVEGHGEAIAPRVEFASAPQVLLARRARQAATGFAVEGDLSFAEEGKLQMAGTNAVAAFAGEAAFTNLEVAGDAAWTSNAAPLAVSGTVTAGKQKVPGSAPVGSIAIWLDAEHIPDGWRLCDGSHGTPDLRNRFLVGVGRDEENNAYACGDTGGTNGVPLSLAQMPAHRHDMFFTEVPTCNESGQHASLDYNGRYEPADDGIWEGPVDPSKWGEWVVPKEVDTKDTGEGAPHENRPPYFAACFIMRTE